MIDDLQNFSDFNNDENEGQQEAVAHEQKIGNIDAILRIPVTIQVILGSAQMAVSQLMRLGRGSVISLDQRIGEAVNIVVNGRVIAKGEVVVSEEDNSRFGVSLTEIVALSKSEKSLK